MFPDANYKQIMAFVRAGKAKKAVIPGEVNPREAELMKDICELDPMSGIDKSRIQAQVKDEDEQEHFTEKDNTVGLSDEDFERLKAERYSRAEMDKDKQKLQNQIS